MKRLHAVALLSAAMTIATAAVVTMTVAAEDAKTDATTTVFRVEGMTCGGCEVGVKVAVKKLEGIEKVTASHQEGRATVTYDPSKVSAEDIEAAIEKIGYQAEVLENEAATSTDGPA